MSTKKKIKILEIISVLQRRKLKIKTIDNNMYLLITHKELIEILTECGVSIDFTKSL